MKPLRALISKENISNCGGKVPTVALAVLDLPDKRALVHHGITTYLNNDDDPIAAIHFIDLKTLKPKLQKGYSLYYIIYGDFIDTLKFAVTHNTDEYDNYDGLQKIGRFNDIEKYL